MSYVVEQQKRLMLEELKSKKELSQKDIQEIVYSLQVASGSTTGVGKIKGILQYLEQSPVNIMEQKIHDKHQLAKLIQSIDQNIDIASDPDFKDYF